MGLKLTARRRRRAGCAPKGGSRRCNWRRCRSRTETSAGFIAGFAGDDRYIVDYLAQEVLQRQPEHVRQFLLQTSILDRLSGPLCDAVTGQAEAERTLAELGASQPVPGAARRPPALVSVPPAVRRRPPGTPDGRSCPTTFAELHDRASRWFAERRCARRGHRPRAGRRETSAERRIS